MYIQILKTIIGKNLGIESMLTPIILHLTLTNRCNSRCIMCNIWSEKEKEDIAPESLKKFKNSSFGRNLRILDMTGGEPFLCDIPSIVTSLDNGKLQTILISTNGFLTDKIIKSVKELLTVTKANIVIDISIDGIGKKHDEIRGIDGAYEKAINTLVKIKALGSDRIRLSLKQTVLKGNFDQIMDCYHKAEELGVDFTCKPGTNFGFLQNENMDFDLQKGDYDKIINDLETISRVRAKNTNYKNLTFWDRFFIVSNDLFSQKLIDYYRILREGDKRMITACYSSFLSVMIHHDSIVYSCPTLMRKIGSISEKSLESVWASDNAKRIRKFINDKKCACFSQCDQMPALVVGSAPKVLSRVLTSYFK
jgi:MoaA/NifB/PqqE/SkfB family radical SAM enzyme